MRLRSNILVVDDELSIRRSYAHILTPVIGVSSDKILDRLEQELFGETVQNDCPYMEIKSCDQGETAIEMVRNATAAGTNFSVVFIDMRMPPGIHGIAAAMEIHAIDPAIEIVFVTGYSDLTHEQILLSFPPGKRLYFVRKPFDGNDIWQLAAGLSLTHAGQEMSDPAIVDVVRKCRIIPHRLIG